MTLTWNLAYAHCKFKSINEAPGHFHMHPLLKVANPFYVVKCAKLTTNSRRFQQGKFSLHYTFVVVKNI